MRTICGAVSIVGRVLLAHPYGSNFASRSNFRGLKCGSICGAVSIVGRVLLAQRVGEPNPYGSNFACSRSNFRASRFTCRPSGAACHKFAARYPSWGEFSSPSGLGNPTPTGSTVCDNTTLRSSGARGLDVSRCYRHVAPLGLNANLRRGIHRGRAVSSP